MNSFASYFCSIKKRFNWSTYIGYLIFLVAIVVCVTIAQIGLFNRSTLSLLTQIGYTIIAVISLSLVVGFLGELSLGHAAFMSIGAICGTLLRQSSWLAPLSESSPLLTLLIACVFGAIIAGIFGFVISLPALRLKGDYLAIVTLAFGEITKTIFQQIDFFGGAIGLKNKYSYDIYTLFIIVFIFAFLFIILVKNLLDSKHGRAITAIRDNEIAAKCAGINVTFYKIFVFVLSACIAGVAGVFYGASVNTIQASTFNYNYSINSILVMVIIGGMGSINGGVVAATIVTILDVKLQTKYLTGDLAAYKDMAYALILIIVIIYRNAPFLANFREKYNFTKLICLIKKGFKIKPSAKEEAKIKHYNADWSKVPTKIDMNAVLSAGMDEQNPLNTVEVEGDAMNEQ